jgi:hypothetical protein
MGITPAFLNLPGINPAGLQDGDVFQYDAATGTMVPLTLPSAGVSRFQDLTDVDFTGVSNGDIFRWNAATGELIPTKYLRLVDGDTISVSVAAGASIEFEIASSYGGPVLLPISASVFYNTGGVNFGLWELGYRAALLQGAGALRGPEITSVTNCMPSGDPTGSNGVLCKFVNRDGVNGGDFDIVINWLEKVA